MAKRYNRYYGNLYYRHYGKERLEQIHIDDPNGIIQLAKERAKERNVTSLTIVVGHYDGKTNYNTQNDYLFYDYDETTGEFKYSKKEIGENEHYNYQRPY